MAALSREINITNQRGLHARASAKFVKCAESFNAQITVSKDGQSVPGTSIMGLMMLGAAKGSDITLHVEGEGSVMALEKLAGLVTDGFGED